MLSEICIDKQKEDTCIEKLGNKDHVSNWGKLLTVCVFTDPLDEFDNQNLEYDIDSNDEEGNTCT